MLGHVLAWVLNVPTVLTFAVVLITSKWALSRRRNSHYNLPPCPWICVPLVGNLFQIMQLKKKIYKHFFDLSKTSEYKGVFTVYFGDMLTKGGRDIVFSPYGEVWKFHKRIGFAAIRKYASGSLLEKTVGEAMDQFLDEVKKEGAGGKPFNIKPHLVLLVVNILAGAMFGKTYDLEDDEMKFFVNITEEAVELLGNGLPADLFPFLAYLPASSRDKKLRDLLERYIKFLEQHFDEHKLKFLGGETEPRDLTDYLLAQQAEAEVEDAGSKDILTDTHFVLTIFDAFGAGLDTLVTSLHSFVAFMAMHQDVQNKLRQEVKDVCGASIPKLADKFKMPYTEACIRESLRRGIFTVLGIPLATTCDTQVGGYDIPKDTWVMVNMWALHNDPDLWEEPDEFRPERFLDDQGKLGPKPTGYMPFSVGRRICLGEALAKNALMLILTRLFQELEVVSPEGTEMKLELDEKSDLVALPKTYDVIIKPVN